MKLPRWLVVSLLAVSMLAVPIYCAWWWVTWPDRTARKFVRSIAQGDADWRTMLAEQSDLRNFELINELWPPAGDGRHVEGDDRSVLDIIHGYRYFFVTAANGGWNFSVARGFVRSNIPESLTIGMELRLQEIGPYRRIDAKTDPPPRPTNESTQDR
jgi:hypothetical protein